MKGDIPATPCVLSVVAFCISLSMHRVNVIGSGPNGLSAAITLARAGARVTVWEGCDQPGGAVRTETATLPGFRHDIGSAVYPMAVASPFFQSLSLQDHGLRWIEPDVPLAHPLPNGDAVGLFHSLDETADLLGPDGAAYRQLMAPVVKNWPKLSVDVLAPLFHMPHHPFALAGFGLHGLQPALSLARRTFQTERARTLFAGQAAHAVVPLSFAATSGVALVLGATAHTGGWPIAAGGAQSITDALVSVLRSFGGELHTNTFIENLGSLPKADCTLVDVSPAEFLRLAGSAVPPNRGRPYQQFQHGPGIFKLDWALSSPIPWTNALCRRAGTVHLGASSEEVAASEADAYYGRKNDRPFVLLSQPSLFDPTRAPADLHTAWAYCHVPNGSSQDDTAVIEAQIERYAPGFQEVVLARTGRNACAMEQWDRNLVGGDVSGGAMTLSQMLRRPKLPPYATPLPGVFLCSSSTPPGGGVHGMCGALAAAAAARFLRLPLPRLS